MTLEIVLEAIKLCLAIIGYAFDEAKKREAEKLSEEQKRDLFDAALAKAVEDLRGKVVVEKALVDKADDAMDAALPPKR